MRINLPIVDREFPFPEGETLVSTTDLQGRILYGNPTFIAVSGYAKAELLGQPHNLIRHPDMPEEAFRDMWETVASGQPWSAPVKNRRKDGSYYWVLANVTPLMEDGRPVGYMSVRTQATREQISAAEALYATMRAERAEERLVHRLHGGTLELRTPWHRMLRLLRPGTSGRVGLVTALAVAAAAGAWTLAQGGTGGTAVLAGALLGGTAAAAAFLAARAVVVGPLEQLVTTANRMAAGDLTQTIEARGRGVIANLTRALAQLNVNLRSIVRDARNEVHHMGDATAEIAAGNQDLSARTEAQAASLEQTAASMEQITSTVRNSAASAESAAKLADQASAVTQRGSQAIGEVNRTMRVIDESSHRIAEIIGVIDSIAFQTNILALNAAVEAARAGEQGRGFAVVASEVRALAGRTTGAAREIKQLIAESGGRVEEGNRITGQALKTIEDALASVQQVGQAVREISEGAQQQLTGISQVNEAVAQIDGITQQNAALVEQVAAAAQHLKIQAVTVSEAVQVFRLDRGPAQRPDAVALRKAARAEIAA